MPRTVEEILAHADKLSEMFEKNDLPGEGRTLDAAALRGVREAFEDLALAQKRLGERVAVARASGHSWAAIGGMVGTSGEAARQRYGGTAVLAGKAVPAKAVKVATGKVTKAAAAASGKATKAEGRGVARRTRSGTSTS
jgi:hypothetical protein